MGRGRDGEGICGRIGTTGGGVLNDKTFTPHPARLGCKAKRLGRQLAGEPLDSERGAKGERMKSGFAASDVPPHLGLPWAMKGQELLSPPTLSRTKSQPTST